MKKVLSLFSGCGGLDWGFKKEGFDIVWANDFEENSCRTYAKNIGKEIHHGDINEVDIDNLPEADIVIGGPPCQAFSLVGKRDPSDSRAGLVWSYFKIIKKIKPSFFLMENVLGIRSAKTLSGEKVIDLLKEEFEKLGYSIQIFLLNSAYYGVPQLRKRVFILGNRLGIENINPPLATHSQDGELFKKWVSSQDALSDLGEPTPEGVSNYIHNPENEFQLLMRAMNPSKITNHFIPHSSDTDKMIISYVKPGGNYMDVPDEFSTKRIMYFKKTGGRTTTYGRLHPEKPSYTLNTYFDRPNVGCNIHYTKDRMITIREGLRIQSFPDDFELVSKTKRGYYMQVGNAVPPLLSLAWAKKIKELINEVP
jgi:DNA (cytosine-5)-methyltransferase 1